MPISQNNSRSLHGSVDWNPACRSTDCFLLVAPFTGAWIEIYCFPHQAGTSFVAPFTGAWIEILQLQYLNIYQNRRSLHGSVDWNFSFASFSKAFSCRSLHGSVDWNFNQNAVWYYSVTSLPSRERGLKFFAYHPPSKLKHVAPFTGAWIEILTSTLFEITASRRSLHGSVDWNQKRQS